MQSAKPVLGSTHTLRSLGNLKVLIVAYQLGKCLLLEQIERQYGRRSDKLGSIQSPAAGISGSRGAELRWNQAQSGLQDHIAADSLCMNGTDIVEGLWSPGRAGQVGEASKQDVKAVAGDLAIVLLSPGDFGCILEQMGT